jgi:hypothetical protein
MSELEILRERLAGASDAELAALAREIFPGIPQPVARLRAAALRLYALRLEPGEWAGLLRHGEPAVIVVDDQEAALVAALLEQDPEAVDRGPLRFGSAGL